MQIRMLSICPSLSSFSFNDDQYSVIPNESEAIDEVDEDDDIPDLNFPVDYDEDDEEPFTRPYEQTDVSDHMPEPVGSLSYVPTSFDVQVDAGREATTVINSSALTDKRGFSYFDESIMKNWAGPYHWKIQRRSKVMVMSVFHPALRSFENGRPIPYGRCDQKKEAEGNVKD